MNLTINQSTELLRIIERNQSISIGKEFGLEFLTDIDIERLEAAGIDVVSLYSPEGDTVFTSFNLGLLSEALGQTEANKLTFDQLREYIKGGNYIPLTQKEKFILENIKRQAFNDVKALNGKIFQDVNQILIDNSLEAQKEFLNKEILEGVGKKETVRKIANKIALKTGDWSRNFDRIIEYASNTAIESAKAEMILRSYGDDALCWKRVYESACKHCISAYTTAGIGSQPKIFKVTELQANGSNIGRKVVDWLPVIGSHHVHCRCSLNLLPKGYKWNPETKAFDIPEKPKLKRKPIRAIIGGKEVFI
jgi:hypothetical protein